MMTSDDTIEIHKARLMAKGYSQIEGVAFINNAMQTILLLVLAITTSQNRHIQQLDVNEIFLGGRSLYITSVWSSSY